MSGLSSQVFRLSALAAVLLFSGPAQAQSRLQQIADDAALAAAQVLGSGAGPEAAVAVAQQTIASVSGVAGEVTMSLGDNAITVKVLQPTEKADAVSTARYVPPEQPAVWSWASRQRFAVKSSPVVVGSNCPQGCDPAR